MRFLSVFLMSSYWVTSLQVRPSQAANAPRAKLAWECDMRIRSPLLVVAPIVMATVMLNSAETPAQEEALHEPGETDAPAEQQAIGGPPEVLASLESSIMAAAENAKRSVVRISFFNDRIKNEESCSGVILSRDGYVATFAYGAFFEGGATSGEVWFGGLEPGKTVSVHLDDGRKVPGVAVDSSWLSFGLVKISREGDWPQAEMGDSADVKPGDLCFAVGYPLASFAGRLPHERKSSVRIGHVVRTEMPGKLRTSCRIDGVGDRGGGLFDLQGRLVGINMGYAHNRAEVHTAVQIVRENWKELARRKPPQRPVPARAPKSGTSGGKTISSSVSPERSQRLAAAVAKAWQATVAVVRIEKRAAAPKAEAIQEEPPRKLSPFEAYRAFLAGEPKEPPVPPREEKPLGFSGVIVSADGYIATCAHHSLPRGADVMIYLADGRKVPAKILGSNPLADVGLAKIVPSGPWPHVTLADVADTKVGGTCLCLGYPNELREAGGLVSAVVRVGRITDTGGLPWQLQSSRDCWQGESGGGLFNDEGRLLGVHHGPSLRAESHRNGSVGMFKLLWKSLVSGPALGDSIAFRTTPTAQRFRKAVEGVSPIVVEVLGGGKRRALGTIISEDGHVLTKASELYGDLSCRLIGGRAVQAGVVNTSRKYDLALLKIDATGLPQIPWSERESTPVGSLVGALRFDEPPTVGVVAQVSHAVASAPGWIGLGTLKDAQGGVEVGDVTAHWTSQIPIRAGDVILHLDGCPTPDVTTFEKLVNPSGGNWVLRSATAGDPIRVGVRRGDEEMELRFPLPSPTYHAYSMNSRRKSGFPAVFDTDTLITPDTCGGPVVDRSGHVVGITIAMPTAYRLYVVPAAVALNVAKSLMNEGSE